MIIVKLLGGLGNQMFQYALARHLSLLHDVPLKLDSSHFETTLSRKYALGVFNIIEDFASSDDITKIKGTGLSRFKCLVQKALPYYARAHICERSLAFDQNILRASQDIYLQGHWQSERYFKDIEEIIRKEFTFKTRLDGANVQTEQLICRVNAVSIHIRRSDYVSNAAINQFHGTCPVAYYRQAVEMIKQMIPLPHFFVFSDDILWARENLVFEDPAVFVSRNDISKDFEDLRLMTLCKYHIIANSTFSWWGAWLNNDPGRIVIAPARWFNDQRINVRDLIPEDWIKI